MACVCSFAERLPGPSRHRALLQTIIEAYEQDERVVLAIGVLGSVARGTWDEWSDLDLDIVTTDAVAEGHRLGGHAALSAPHTARRSGRSAANTRGIFDSLSPTGHDQCAQRRRFEDR